MDTYQEFRGNIRDDVKIIVNIRSLKFWGEKIGVQRLAWVKEINERPERVCC